MYGPVPSAVIHGVVRQIAEQFRPNRVILFGSHARGNAQANSDVDLLVEMETPLREAEQAVAICRAIEYRFPLDLIVRTPETIARRLAMGDPFLREVMAEGHVLYDATRS